MSMIVKLIRMPAAQLERYKAAAGLLTARIYGDSEEEEAMMNMDKSRED